MNDGMNTQGAREWTPPPGHYGPAEVAPTNPLRRVMEDLSARRLTIGGVPTAQQMFVEVENAPGFYLTAAQGLELAEHLQAVARATMGAQESGR